MQNNLKDIAEKILTKYRINVLTNITPKLKFKFKFKNNIYYVNYIYNKIYSLDRLFEDDSILCENILVIHGNLVLIMNNITNSIPTLYINGIQTQYRSLSGFMHYYLFRQLNQILHLHENTNVSDIITKLQAKLNNKHIEAHSNFCYRTIPLLAEHLIKEDEYIMLAKNLFKLNDFYYFDTLLSI